MSFNTVVMITVKERGATLVPDSQQRSRREMTLEERSKQCKDIEISQKSFSTFSDILGDINSIPIIGDVAGTWAAGAAIVTHLTAGGLDIAQTVLDCGDIPFDEIKAILDKRFNEVNRKLDQNAAALEAVSKLVSKALSAVERVRNEMNQRFDEVLVSIKETAIWPIVSKIDNFASYFDTERERIIGLKSDEYISKLKEPNSILIYLKDSRTPKGDSLHAPLFDIIHRGYAVPKSIDDKIAFKALDALLYGTQTYVSVMFFLLEQYSFLASYHYERGLIDEYNKYFDSINNVYLDFKSSLIGSGTSRGEPLLDKVNGVLLMVKTKDFLRLQKDDLIQMLNEKIDYFSNLKNTINDNLLNIITETPENFLHISFQKNISTPVGGWEAGRKVQYAVQYKGNDKYSKVGDWSVPQTIRAKACPTLRLAVDPRRKTRLIFRKLEGDRPQLIGSAKPYDTELTDIDRDLYNAAELPDPETGLNEAKIFLDNNANMNTVFEKGRTVLHAVAQSGNAKLLIYLLLNNKALDISLRDKYGFTPMHIASDVGNAGFVKFLIDNHASVNPKTDGSLQTPLHLAARHGFVKTTRRLLASSDIKINEKNKDGFTPLHNAVLGGKFMIKALISKEGIEINPRSAKGLTPFHLAAINNDCLVAEALVKSNKVEINAGDEKNMTALHYAAMFGYLEMTRFLMNLNGVDLNAVTAVNKWSPLHYSITFKRDDVALELLTSNDININAKADGEITPLQFSVIFGRKRIVNELLAKSVSINEQTKENYTALHLAAMRKDPDILEILIDGGANIEAKAINGSSPLHVAVTTGRTNTALALLNKGVDSKVFDKNGQAAIHIATMKDHLEMVRELIARDATLLEMRNRDSETPLNVAASHFLTVLVKDLLDKGADINTRNKDGISPLIIFSKKGDLDMVTYLLNKGADAYLADNKGINFFYYAIQNGHLSIVKSALEGKKIDWERRDEKRKDGCRSVCTIDYFAFCDSIVHDQLDIFKHFIKLGYTKMCDPLYTAARHGHLDIVKFLVEDEKENPNGRKIRALPNTPLCEASINGHLEVVEYLISKEVKVNKRCEVLFTAIDLAIHRNHIEVVKYLAEHGADLLQANFHGDTPLHTALGYDRFEIVKYFAEKQKDNIDINEKNSDGDTPLHVAVKKNNLDLVECFVENGANVTVENSIGETPLALARIKNQTDIIQYLESKGGRLLRRTGFRDYEYIGPNANTILKPIIQVDNDNQKYPNMKSDALYSPASYAFLKNVDIIGTLLLLDTAIRYFTKKKFVETREHSSSDVDIQVAALKITEKFQDLWEFFNNIPVEEHLDVTEVHRDVYAALKSGKASQVHQVICSYLNAFSALESEDLKQLISDFIEPHYSIPIAERSLKRQMYENFPQLFAKSCLKIENSISEFL